MRCLLAENQRYAILASVPPNGRMLEWGTGGSTLWFLDHLDPAQQLIGVEHDAGWYMQVTARAGDRANYSPRLHEAHFGAGENATPWEECPAGLADYIHPTPLSDIDVFLIDGVARGACLANVMLNGKSGARVFLHDANRAGWYDWAQRLGRATDVQVIKAADGDYPPDLWTCRLR